MLNPPPPAAGSAREAASSGQTTTTSGQALGKLVLEPEDERLTDKVQLGARLLAGLRQKQSAMAAAAELSGSKQNYSSPPAALLASNSHYFIAGAQLDADTALQWFASATMAAATAATTAPVDRGDQPRLPYDDDDALQLQQQPQGQAENSIRLDWPEQVCRRRCGQSFLVRGALADNNDYSDLPAATAVACGQTSGSTDENQTTTDGAGQTSADAVISGFTWLRPLVLALQTACTLTTLCLIGILFRLRKSRVSSNLLLLRLSFLPQQPPKSTLSNHRCWPAYFYLLLLIFFFFLFSSYLVNEIAKHKQAGEQTFFLAPPYSLPFVASLRSIRSNGAPATQLANILDSFLPKPSPCDLLRAKSRFLPRLFWCQAG